MHVDDLMVTSIDGSMIEAVATGVVGHMENGGREEVGLVTGC